MIEKKSVKTIHVIFNTHIDPVWLWPWQAGMDELLATCRIACDILDRHPDMIYNRGEAWVYRQIELVEPQLFRRIQAHVKAGRWEIVGGWWIQPDCNLPSGFAFEKQIALGREYFRSRFGRFPTVAYNVDSFGHAATLPGYMAAHGQKYYVMMRPQEHEKKLPARLFRWRGFPGTPEVTTFRIAGSYSCDKLRWEHFDKALTELPGGINDTMCFVSAGDHGGGPTEKQIAWIRENRDARKDIRLEISTPARFFAKVKRLIPTLPLVTGELQHHAVGCYTVHRAVKTGMRRAEHLLHQAEFVRGQLGRRAAALPGLQRGWEQVCFNHFHDTLGGSCVPTANQQSADQLGEAASLADENVHNGLRMLLASLPDDAWQRMVISNPSPRDFRGYFEAEPWTEGMPWENVRIVDEKGKTVCEQKIHTESNTSMNFHRIVFALEIPAGGRRILTLRLDLKPVKAAPDAAVRNGTIQNRLGLRVRPARKTRLSFPPGILTPELELIGDPSDTWAHKLDRFGNKVVARPKWQRPEFPDAGPLMASCIQNGIISHSRVQAEYRVHAGSRWITLRLRVNWNETHKVLKLTLRNLPLAGNRTDGILGGRLVRENSGVECPLRDWTLFSLSGGKKLGIVCPDVFGIDATSERVRFTLLRSPWLACHEPNTGSSPRGTIADQGLHEFRFLFALEKNLQPEHLEQEAWQLQQPPIYADVTKGMPARCWAGN